MAKLTRGQNRMIAVTSCLCAMALVPGLIGMEIGLADSLGNSQVKQASAEFQDKMDRLNLKLTQEETAEPQFQCGTGSKPGTYSVYIVWGSPQNQMLLENYGTDEIQCDDAADNYNIAYKVNGISDPNS